MRPTVCSILCYIFLSSLLYSSDLSKILQSKRKISVSDVDNSPESLLAFTGNKNVHGLYDFLLNYR